MIIRRPRNLPAFPEWARNFVVLGKGSEIAHVQGNPNFEGLRIRVDASPASRWEMQRTQLLDDEHFYAAGPQSPYTIATLRVPADAVVVGYAPGRLERGRILQTDGSWGPWCNLVGNEPQPYVVPITVNVPINEPGQTAEAAQPATNPTPQPEMEAIYLPEMPAGFPALPTGYVYLGAGGRFQTPRPFLGAVVEPGISTEWEIRHDTLNGASNILHYAAPADSEVVRANLPSLPEPCRIIGYGRDDLRPGDFAGYAIEVGRENRWVYADDYGGAVTNFIYAIPLRLEPDSLGGESAAANTVSVPAARQWDLGIDGALVEPDSILAAIIPHLDDPANGELVASMLDRACRCSDPEEIIRDLVDKEPILMGMVEFIPLASTQGVDIQSIAESEATIAEVITKAAAGVLLRGGFSRHFRYLEDGTLAIDPSSPPTVEQAYELLHRTLEMKETASKLDNYSAWMLGMIADQFETYFGQRFDPSVIMTQTSRAYNTYITSLGTYREWWQEKRNLSFTHHREVFYAKHLNHDTGGKVLDLSEKFSLTVKQQRKLISYAKRFDVEQLEADLASEDVSNVESFMERIDIRAVNKRYLFFLRAANQWYEYKGPFEHIPNGASPIINADTREIMAQDGRATKPDEWIVPGQPVATEEEDEDES